MDASDSIKYSACASDCSFGVGNCTKSGDQNWAGVNCGSVSLLLTPSLLNTVCDLVRPPDSCDGDGAISSGE